MIILLHLLGLAAYLLTGYGLVRLLLASKEADTYRKSPGWMGGIFLLWPVFLFWVLFYWIIIGLGVVCRLVGKSVLK